MTELTPDAFAALLNGREYREEITNAEHQQARAAGLVVMFGGSDDLVYFAGALNDEQGCGHGSEFFVAPDGFRDEDSADARTSVITARWSKDGYSWSYVTDIPHSVFDIVEDDDKYCRGIVFRLSDTDRTAGSVGSV